MHNQSKPVVLVTDVSTGMGALVARQFLTRGWTVIGMVGSGQNAKLKSKTLDVQPAVLSRSGDLERVIRHAVRRYRQIDAVIFNGGYSLIGPVDSLTYSQMREQLSVNVLAVAELVRLVVPEMVRQGGGTMVGLTNLFGAVGLPGYSLYSASQHAANGLFESLYFELKSAGIRVKMVDPGGIGRIGNFRLKLGTTRKWRESELGPQFGLLHGRPPRSTKDAKEAAAVYDATVDRSTRMRYGKGPRLLKLCRKLLPESLYHQVVKRTMI